MNFDFQKLFRSKTAHRQKLAALPNGKKLRLLDPLRESALACSDASVTVDISDFLSASLGVLRAFAVKNSSTAIRSIDFNFGKEPANSFTQDQHPDLRADCVMALPSAAVRLRSRSHPAYPPAGRINPPFNIKEWWDGKLEGDAHFKANTFERQATWLQLQIQNLICQTE